MFLLTPFPQLCLWQLVRRLLEKGADQAIPAHKGLQCPVHKAALYGDLDTLQALHDNNPDCVNWANDSGLTVLHYLPQARDDPALLRWAIPLVANRHTLTNDDNSALGYAGAVGAVRVFAMLVDEFGFDPKHRNMRGFTCFDKLRNENPAYVSTTRRFDNLAPEAAKAFVRMAAADMKLDLPEAREFHAAFEAETAKRPQDHDDADSASDKDLQELEQLSSGDSSSSSSSQASFQSMAPQQVIDAGHRIEALLRVHTLWREWRAEGYEPSAED